jgi:hypothetical protein
MLSLLRKPAPSPTNAAIIELIYAGNDMAAHLVMQDGSDYSCVCGMIAGPIEDSFRHRSLCPVGRYYAAVEAVRKAERSQAETDVDQDSESLRNGTARYNTPREDAILFSVLAAIAAVLVAAILLCAHYAQKAGLPW